MLYTLDHGRWSQNQSPPNGHWETLDQRWRTLIRHALAWSRERPPDLNETIEFIRYVRDRSQQSGDAHWSRSPSGPKSRKNRPK